MNFYTLLFHFSTSRLFLLYYTYRIALNITKRCSRIGSFSTRLSLLNTIVGRSVALKGVQRGSLGVFGLPVRANAIHVSLTLSASAIAPGPPPVRRVAALTLSNANGISIVCGDLSRPPSTGVSQRK